MKIKECYVSKNGISCFTDINTMLTVNEIYNNKYLLKITSNLIIYFKFRLIEFVISDFIKNKDLLLNIAYNNYLLD